ncbi:MAG: hypothetical protein ACC628_12370 [Pirellulaceae bacterium]
MKRFTIKITMHLLGDEIGEGYFDPNGDLVDDVDAALKLSAEELPKYLPGINWDIAIRVVVESVVDEV